MIFLHLPSSCFPSELIANDNNRKGHNGDSTNNLPPGFANLNICRSYKRVMNNCFVCVRLDCNFKTEICCIKTVGLIGLEQFVHKKRIIEIVMKLLHSCSIQNCADGRPVDTEIEGAVHLITMCLVCAFVALHPASLSLNFLSSLCYPLSKKGKTAPTCLK